MVSSVGGRITDEKGLVPKTKQICKVNVLIAPKR